ncbi:RAB6A-GEF complex partner protein 2-like isoform X2 [Anneissia japonica]|uniref:RAB6A-GEF complex partner protein 2-like isoform X2 n=1 Tax=Anneissia japonica TaxID=1529436 RepID=UPI00142592B9|nr:RAB6A-GEF complex partner protein 2-like isoform X2 [Anneissia japonica]
MIDVHACLVRGSVFLAGEAIECVITFSNKGHSRSETLAWASAQLHCQCSVSDSKVKLPIQKSIQQDATGIPLGSATSFTPNRGEKGICVVSTTPKILVCDLVLSPGESKTYTYFETIPQDAPPSYKGQSVKYSYKVTIGTQRVNSPTRLLRVPFRVLVLYGLGETFFMDPDDDFDTDNPFLQGERKPNSLLDQAVQVLTTITSRKSSNTYNITNAHGTVARFCIFKSAYKLGEDIIATFDFSNCPVSCIQYSVTLQSEEQITEECRRRSNQGVSICSYSKHQEFCVHISKSHMILPIPLHLTPSFITDIVCLKWRLRFEFVTSKEPLPEQVIPADQSESATWQGPQSLGVETMVWNLPIKIMPTNPLHATSVSLLRAVTTMSV